MKVNARLFDRVVTEPFDIQELENGSTVELHSLNQNEELYQEFMEIHDKKLTKNL